MFERILVKIHKLFPALKERNFRLYFYGQIISLAGTWLQSVAQGWLVLELTNSAFWVGTVTTLAYLPTVFLGLFGGVIVDRFNRRTILYITQFVPMVLAFILGILTITHRITLWEILVLAFLLGIVNALDIPARQAFVADMVSKENLASAIALNSALTNSARTIGPALAGILIVWVGTGGTFILNGFSFVAVIIALAMMRLRIKFKPEVSHPITMIKDGLRYVFSHAGLAWLMVLSAATSIFGYSYIAILPVVAKAVFNGNASTFGILVSGIGFGSVIGAITISALSKKVRSRFFIIGGNLLLGGALMGFSLAHNIYAALPFVILAGFAFTIEFSIINTIIQHEVEPTMRGRTLSIFVFMFLGGQPLGTLATGYSAEKVGAPLTIAISGFIVLLIGGILLLRKDHLLELKRR